MGGDGGAERGFFGIGGEGDEGFRGGGGGLEEGGVGCDVCLRRRWELWLEGETRER